MTTSSIQNLRDMVKHADPLPKMLEKLPNNTKLNLHTHCIPSHAARRATQFEISRIAAINNTEVLTQRIKHSVTKVLVQGINWMCLLDEIVHRLPTHFQQRFQTHLTHPMNQLQLITKIIILAKRIFAPKSSRD
jgi:hypothetical protein